MITVHGTNLDTIQKPEMVVYVEGEPTPINKSVINGPFPRGPLPRPASDAVSLLSDLLRHQLRPDGVPVAVGEPEIPDERPADGEERPPQAVPPVATVPVEAARDAADDADRVHHGQRGVREGPGEALPEHKVPAVIRR